MKNIVYILFLILLINACNTDTPKNYMTFSGKIENKKVDSIIVLRFYEQVKKRVIKLAPDGKFKDTLTVQNGFYRIYTGYDISEKAYFKNGDNIIMNVDLDDYYQTLTFTGKGAAETNLARKEYLMRKNMYESGLMDLSETDFKVQTNNYSTTINNLLGDKTLDSTFVIIQKGKLNSISKNILEEFESVLYIRKNLSKGTPSPKFNNYTNYNDTTTSLNEFKGKYVYIDFWDTYCPPCIKQFPALEKLIEKYKSKNIEFVYLSLNRKSEFEEWKNFIASKKLNGTQLIISDRKFLEAYKVNAIPRYALIDPEGNIVDADTFKPSDPKLVDLFNSLKI